MDALELAAIGDALGMSYRGVHKRAATQSWPYTTRSVRGGQQRLYPIETLPAPIRDAVLAHQAQQALQEAANAQTPSTAKATLGRGSTPRIELAAALAHIPSRAHTQGAGRRADEAARRLSAITPIIQWPAGQKGKKAFIEQHAKNIGESTATLYRWLAAYNAGGAAALVAGLSSEALIRITDDLAQRQPRPKTAFCLLGVWGVWPNAKVR